MPFWTYLVESPLMARDDGKELLFVRIIRDPLYWEHERDAEILVSRGNWYSVCKSAFPMTGAAKVIAVIFLGKCFIFSSFCSFLWATWKENRFDNPPPRLWSVV